MKYLADTDFLVDLFRQRRKALIFLQNIDPLNSQLYTSAINGAELFEGAYKSQNVTKSLMKVQTLLDSFILLDFSITHAKSFGELISRLRGTKIGDMDTLIASIGLYEGMTIITKNTKHFERTGIPIITW